MNNQEALNTLKDIRKMMEKSSRFFSLNGLSAIVVGIYACIAAVIAYFILGGDDLIRPGIIGTYRMPMLQVNTPYRLILTASICCNTHCHMPYYSGIDVPLQSPQKQSKAPIRPHHPKAIMELFPALNRGRYPMPVPHLAAALWANLFHHADILWHSLDKRLQLYLLQHPLSGLCRISTRTSR